jgi:hypothetical protein
VVRRWRCLRRPGRPRALGPDQLPVDETLKDRRRRIWVPGINPEFLIRYGLRDELDRITQDWSEK